MSLRRLGAASSATIMASAAVAGATDAPASRLAIFPNTTIEYYDVKGATVTAINQSIRAQRAISAVVR